MESAKWTPNLRAFVVIAFVEEKKRKIRQETFDLEAWNRVLNDFNSMAEVSFAQGQIGNQLSIIKKLIRDGNQNKEAGPTSNLTDVGNNCPRLLDNLVDSSIISDADWEIFYKDVKAGRSYQPSPDKPAKKKSRIDPDSSLQTPVSSSSREATPGLSSVLASRSVSSAAVPLDGHSAISSPKESVRLFLDKKKHAAEAVEPVVQIKREESKMELAMKIISKDFSSLTGEEQLMVGLALTQSSYQDLFLSLGTEGRKAFVNKFKTG